MTRPSTPKPRPSAEGTVPSQATHKPRGWLARKLADPPMCAQNGCPNPPADDSDRCPQHRDAQRARGKAYAAKRYLALRKPKRGPKRCTGCRRPSLTTRCEECRVVVGRAPKRSLDTRLDTASRTWLDPTGRMRFHGQERRGRQTNASLDAQAGRDAQKSLLHMIDGLAYYHSPEVQAKPRIERDGIRRAALAHGDHVQRCIEEDIFERHKYREDLDRAAPRPRGVDR